MNVRISDRYIRSVMKEYAGLTSISADAIKIVKEYLDGEAHRIAEAGVKEFLAKNELRKIRGIRRMNRIPGSIYGKVLEHGNT